MHSGGQGGRQGDNEQMSEAPQTENARLSRLLFYAREEIEMWADVVERRTGRTAAAQRRVIRELDEFRTEKGWHRNGFGGEL
jgi:hypothetical protein